MSLLVFPDVNVWLALILQHHVRRASALAWWNGMKRETVGFTRITQISVVRVLTAPAAMDGKPLAAPEAWAVYDRLLEDDRVAMYGEPADLEVRLRQFCDVAGSRELWADAYLLAFAACHDARIVTFDGALRRHGVDCVVLQ